MTDIVLQPLEEGGVFWMLGVVVAAMLVCGVTVFFGRLGRKLQLMNQRWATLPVAAFGMIVAGLGFVLSGKLFLGSALNMHEAPLIYEFIIIFTAGFVITGFFRLGANFADRVMDSDLVERSLQRLQKKH